MRFVRVKSALRVGILAGLSFVSVAPVTTARGADPVCPAVADLVRLAKPLPHLAARLAAGGPVRIVALGSSSTVGLGASRPENAYPARLEANLRRRFPGVAIEVLNRGVNGNETRDEMLRFERDVLAEAPDLVIWQIGTNTLIRGNDKWQVFLDARAGIRRLRAQGADVVLMNPQYSPRVLARADWEAMIDLIEVTGRETAVDVFDRFAMMRHWSEGAGHPFGVYITPDGLHMNDWGYACLADTLEQAIVRAANLPVAGP